MKIGPWECDTCGKAIRQEEDGLVEWLGRTNFDKNKDKTEEYGLRLVHARPSSPKAGGCQYDENKEYNEHEADLQDLGLEEYVGIDGLMNLLEMIAEKKLPTEELVEMIKRLHIPGYEQARNHFESAISKGIIELNSTPGFYSQEKIQEVVQWAAEQREQ